MCFKKGVTVSEIISQSKSNYPLAGKLGITISNVGTSDCLVDNWNLKTGENYYAAVPGVIYQNDIAIKFASTDPSDCQLQVGYTRLVEEEI